MRAVILDISSGRSEYFGDLLVTSEPHPDVFTEASFAWATLLAFETLAFGLTLYKTSTLARRNTLRPSVPTLLLRDGAVFYAVMTVGAMANIIALNVSHFPIL
jgi:hypothetical protein